MADKNLTIEVEILTMVYGGDGMGRLPDGRAVFVPFTIPGEQVRVRLVEEKRGHARAELVEVTRPASERIQPRCAHFGFCGGCHYQQFDYPRQLEIKEAVLREQLERIGGIQTPPVEKMVPSPSPWNYRNTVQFQVTREGKLGYFPRFGSEVFAIRECFLPEGAIVDLWPRLEAEPVPGLERIELRVGAGDEVLMVMESSDPEAPEFQVDLPISAVHMGPKGPLVLSGDEQMTIEVLDKSFQVSAGSFFQVNTAQAGAMVRYLLEHLPLNDQIIFMDVYCGVGLFSAFVAEKVKRCIGIEVSPYACDDFAANLDPYDNVELYDGTAEDVLPFLQVRPDVMVVDPPRAGLERAALEAILTMRPSTLAYVSCDPATLARDLKRLTQAGYSLDCVKPFDLFPQTYHIESISFLRAT